MGARARRADKWTDIPAKAQWHKVSEAVTRKDA
jgi:hypothetical protein